MTKVETLNQMFEYLREHHPARVLVDEGGTAIDAATALDQFHIAPDYVLVRDDGWVIGTPASLLVHAHELWTDKWIGCIEIDGGNGPSRILDAAQLEKLVRESFGWTYNAMIDRISSLAESLKGLPDPGELDGPQLIHAMTLVETAHRLFDAAKKAIGAYRDRAKHFMVEYFVEEGIDSVKAHGMTLSLRMDYRPGYAWKDLLPPDIDPEDPDYKTTIEQCRASGKQRLLEALKACELAHLVHETFNANSLRSALTGKDAELDEDGDPIIPDAIQGKVELNPEPTIAIRKA